MITPLTTLSYIDPATTTALLSSISSIGVAVGAAFLIFWRKFKKSIVKMLRLDENSGKIVEDELVIYDKEILADVEKQDVATALEGDAGKDGTEEFSIDATQEKDEDAKS